MKSCKEYRAESKAALKGNWGTAIGMMIVFDVIFAALTSTVLGAILLSGALTVGYAFAMTQVFRKGKLTFNEMFHGFNIDFGSTIGLYVLTTIYTILWSLLFVIPGIVKSFSYSMAPYILADHPEIGGDGAITASKKLMRGKKWKLFCLDLSFLGWLILCAMTFGILTLWVAPWMSAAQAAFYESIKDEVVIED